MKRAMLILAMTAAFTGCLEKEVTHTLYLEADDSVTWEVLERNVYSSSSAAEDREREEREYFELAMAGRPSVLEALGEIGGTDLRSEFLRDRRPYSLRVTAHFKDLRAALTGLFEAADADAEVRLEAHGERRVLTITATEVDLESSDEEDIALLEALIGDDLRFVLAAGKFDEGDGFTLENHRTAILTGEPDEQTGGRTRVRLGWTVEAPRD